MATRTHTILLSIVMACAVIVRVLDAESDPEIRTFMPAALTEALADEIDVWVLPPGDWAEKRDLVDKLRKQGKRSGGTIRWPARNRRRG